MDDVSRELKAFLDYVAGQSIKGVLPFCIPAFCEAICKIKYPTASNGVFDLAAVTKCLQAATWLVARGNK